MFSTFANMPESKIYSLIKFKPNTKRNEDLKYAIGIIIIRAEMQVTKQMGLH